MKKYIGKNHRIWQVLYAVMLTIFFCMAIYFITSCKSPSISQILHSSSISFADGWRTVDGEAVTVNSLHKISSAVPYKEFSIVNTIPEGIGEGQSLFFRSKNIYYAVYIGGELAYEPYVPENVLYTNSFGTRWNSIPLLAEDAGKQIEIKITIVYGNSRAGIDTVTIGDSGGQILESIRGRLVAMVTTTLLLFSALFFILADIPVNMQIQKNHELLYLGLFAMSIGVWCLCETNFIQFYFDDSRAMQVISCSALMLIPIPMVLYLDASFGFLHKLIVPGICGLSVAEFAVCWLLHLSGIADIHETLTLTHIMATISAVLLFVTIVRNYLQTRKENSRKRTIYRLLRSIGLCTISVTAIIDILRYKSGDMTDSAKYVRIGLLVFILCYGSSSMERTIDAVRLGMQTEFISRLAYHDTLTGIGNRTAYEAQLADIDKIKDRVEDIGIAILDANDLKKLNDKKGHDLGDAMLKKIAEFLNDAFRKEGGSCFRIGGDEFAVLLCGKDVWKRFENGMKTLEADIERHNAQKEKLFSVSLAHGFAVYDKTAERQELIDVFKAADHRMYENKQKMKETERKEADTVQG